MKNMSEAFGQGVVPDLRTRHQAVCHREALLDGDLVVLVDKNAGSFWMREW
jgi:hypothetical protein